MLDKPVKPHVGLNLSLEDNTIQLIQRKVRELLESGGKPVDPADLQTSPLEGVGAPMEWFVSIRQALNGKPLEICEMNLGIEKASFTVDVESSADFKLLHGHDPKHIRNKITLSFPSGLWNIPPEWAESFTLIGTKGTRLVGESISDQILFFDLPESENFTWDIKEFK